MGWLEAGMDLYEAEDVAQHSFETASITLILSDWVDEEIDTGRALKIAVVHDWAESVTGDFSKEATETLGSKIKEEIEEKVFENVLMDDLPGEGGYLELWREYRNCETPEAKIVRISDLLSILVEARKLFERGEESEKLREIWNSVMEDLEKFQTDFPVLESLLSELDRC